MVAHVEEDHFSDASFREMYFRPSSYDTISSEKDESVESIVVESRQASIEQKSSISLNMNQTLEQTTKTNYDMDITAGINEMEINNR